MIRKWMRRLSYWAARHRKMDAERVEQMESHREMVRRNLERRGVPAKDADVSSRRAMGNAVLAHKDARAVWIWPWAEQSVQDVRFAKDSQNKRDAPGTGNRQEG